MRSTVLAFTVAAMLAGAAGTSCRERESARRESERATAAAEEIASQTTITSGTVEDADDPVAGAAIRSEQGAYRAKLGAAIDALEQDITETRADARRARRNQSHVKVLLAKRELLKQHLEAMDRGTTPDWPALKAKIDRDLGNETGR